MRKILPFLLLLLVPLFSDAQNIYTIAGCGIGDDSLATRAELNGPYAVAADPHGNIYIADRSNFRIRKVDVSGVITTIAGNGFYGNSGDGGPAVNASFGSITGIAADGAGNVYISDISNYRIRKIDPTGIITAFAGTGAGGHSGDGGLADSAQLLPYGLAVDTLGNLYVCDNNNVRLINVATGIITNFAGNGTSGYSGDSGLATAAELSNPQQIALDHAGNLFIADGGNFVVRKVDASGIITTIAGVAGSYTYRGDGGPALSAYLGSFGGIAADTIGNVYISDIWNIRVRKINTVTGIINEIAGTPAGGYSGDGGIGVVAELSYPQGVACDLAGNVYIADLYNNRIRKVNPADIITTFAGQNGQFEEGYYAVDAKLNLPGNLAIDGAGNIYVADVYNQRIRRISTSGIITTAAGSGISGVYDPYVDGCIEANAHLFYPSAVALDAHDNMYIADEYNNRVRRGGAAAGTIFTIAGNGAGGDGGLAINAFLNNPSGVALDTAGNIYIADYADHRIRKIDVVGIIHTVAGNGTAGYSGDGGAATAAQIQPFDVTIDAAGNLYIADKDNNCIRKVNAAGVITTIAGTGTAGYSGSGGPAVLAEINSPNSVKTDGRGNVYFSDYSNHVSMTDTAGIMHTIAGTGTPGFSGDGGPAIDAELSFPTGVAIDGGGNIYISDQLNNRIRKITSPLSASQVKKNTSSIFLYPNPATTQLTIQSVNEPITKIIITDILGQTVYAQYPSAEKVQVDISGLSPGVYLVKLNDSEVRKFVKE